MANRRPDEIWRHALEEGERRLTRSPLGIASTALIGGGDIGLGVLALVITTSVLDPVLPAATAHVLASLSFGIAFVFIVVGRSELFTENFLVPVAAVHAGRGPLRRLLRLWGISLVFNLAALTVLAYVFTIPGVFPDGYLDAAGKLADVYVERDFVAAFVSALLAGGVMTLFTWFVEATAGDGAHIAIALLVGFLLAAPYLNHAIVSYGEVLLGITTGASEAGFDDLLANLGIATFGNLLGGIGLVTATRLWQARGEQGEEGPA